MSMQTWQETLATGQTDGTALTASVTPTSILHATSKPTFPIGYFSRVGMVIRVKAAGRISNIVTTPGTLTLDLRLGAVIIANGGAMALNVVAKSNVPWWLDWTLTLRAVGAGVNANFMHQGVWSSESVIGSPLPSAGGAGSHMLPNAAPAVGTSFDANLAAALDLFATWSLSNANSIQVHQSMVEVVN